MLINYYYIIMANNIKKFTAEEAYKNKDKLTYTALTHNYSYPDPNNFIDFNEFIKYCKMQSDIKEYMTHKYI